MFDKSPVTCAFHTDEVTKEGCVGYIHPVLAEGRVCPWDFFFLRLTVRTNESHRHPIRITAGHISRPFVIFFSQLDSILYFSFEKMPIVPKKLLSIPVI